jgi:hypothetical protein
MRFFEAPAVTKLPTARWAELLYRDSFSYRNILSVETLESLYVTL